MKTQAQLITNKTNITYLSNFTGSSGFMLLTPKKNYLFTDFRYLERAKNSIKKGIEIVDITRVWRNPKDLKENWIKIIKKHNITNLGVEENDLSVTRYKKFKKISAKIKLVDISGKIEEQREIKTKKEISLIEESQRINEKVYTEIKKIVQSAQKTGKKIYEIELAWKIKELAYKFGAEDISFDPIIAFGKNSALPHHLSGKTQLKKDDIVLIDMGMKYKGYCSDMSRTLFPLKADSKQREIYDLVLTAQENGIKNIKAGITGKKADEFSRKIIEKAGYGEKYGHAGGHGIGLDIHETPSLSEKYTKKLKENSIITVEPGIYLEGKFGVRIEDMILITKKGNKNLTKVAK